MYKLPKSHVILWMISLGMILGGCKKSIENLHVTDVVNNHLLSSLGVEKRTPPDRFYEPELLGFVGEFIEDARKRGVIISADSIDKLRQVKYVDQLSTPAEPGVIAACSRYFIEESSITGNKNKIKWTIIEVLHADAIQFTKSNRIRLRELMYHEIFHCLMNKGHLPKNVDGIMSATFAKNDNRAFKDWTGLVDDMFSLEYINMIPDTE